jgi:toxin CcdB
MPQFAVHRNRNTATKVRFPFLLDVLLTPQLAGIFTKELGPPIADLSHDRQAIMAALDLLSTGI